MKGPLSPSLTFLCLAANLVLAITIVFVNKYLYVHMKFPNITLTFTHFCMTYLGLIVCEKLDVFQVKRLPVARMVPLAVTFCGFVVFTNLSLGYNTVGTYQVTKSLTMPTIMFIQSVWYRKTLSRKTQLTLIPISLGVILNSLYDIKFNIVGTVFALIGVLVTSLHQVWVGEKQKEFQVNSMQLLYYQAPLSAALLLVFVLLLEQPWALFQDHIWTFQEIFTVLLSGCIAFAINLSIYWIIGNTSAVTYNVTGQLKFCLTLLGGYLLFQDPVHVLQLVGIFLTFLGVLLYSHTRLKENQEKTKLPLVQKS